MNAARRAALEAHGWTVGDAQAFLGLSDEEQAFIDRKLSLAESLRRTQRAHAESSPCDIQDGRRQPDPLRGCEG